MEEENYDPFDAIDKLDADVQRERVRERSKDKDKDKGDSDDDNGNTNKSNMNTMAKQEEKEEEEADDLLRQVRELTMSLKKTQKAKSELQRKLSLVQTSHVKQQEELKQIRRTPFCPPVPAPKMAKVVRKPMKPDPDVCWEFNSKAGCKNSSCQWKHINYPTYSNGRSSKSEETSFQPFGGTDIMKKVLEDNKRLGMGHKYGASSSSSVANGSNSKRRKDKKGAADQKKKGQRYEEALRLKQGINASRDLDVCWEFNSWSGCSKDRECLWSHQWLVNEAVHPWTGEKLRMFYNLRVSE